MRVISLRTKGGSNDPLGTRSDQVSPGGMPGLILLLVVLTGVLTFFCSTYRIFSLPEYRVGDIATSEILVPADVPMQDEEATRIRQEEARNAALPVYRHSVNQVQARIERICRLFSTLRSQLKRLDPNGSPGAGWSFDKLPPEIQASLGEQLSRLMPESNPESAARFLSGIGFSLPLQQALEQALGKASSSLVIESARDLIREQGSIHVLSGTGSGERTTIPVDQVKTLDSIRQEVDTWLPALLRYHELPLQPTSRLVSDLPATPIFPMTLRPPRQPNGKRWPMWTRSSSFSRRARWSFARETRSVQDSYDRSKPSETFPGSPRRRRRSSAWRCLSARFWPCSATC